MQSSKTFRLFISSTFNDFEKEREILHKKVFPLLERYCAKNGFTFQAIDLRWGINSEAQLDQKTLELCLQEVRTCKHFPPPNFLVMIGNRYGYVPLPYMIEKTEFEKIKGYIKSNNKKITIVYKSEKKLEKDAIIAQQEKRITTKLKLLEQWYKIDENQIYINSNKKESTAYILQPRTEAYKIYTYWQAEEDILREIFQESVEYLYKIQEIDKKEYEKYFLSATEQEVIEGVCAYKDKTKTQKKCNEKIDNKYIFAYIRDINNAEGKYIDESIKLQNRVRIFKENLQTILNRKTNILSIKYMSIQEYEADNLKVFEKFVTKKLINSCNKQFKEFKTISKLEQEIIEHKKFMYEKIKNFQGREKTLSKIEKYINTNKTNQPLIIHGPSGIGKSSLLAKAIKNINSTNIIFRFVGATTDSSNYRTLLISIVDELQKKNLINKIIKYESDNDKFDQQISYIFSSINKDVILFIDALDQLQCKNHLNWLPNKFQPNLKVILSVLNDKQYKEDTHYFNILFKKYKNSIFIDLKEDSLEKNKNKLINEMLKVKNRKLDKYQTNLLLRQWEKTGYSPLYLKIATEIVKSWKSGEKPKNLSDSIEGIILEYLENLTSQYHHEKVLIIKVFGYIYASKYGLSEHELLQILSEDLEDEQTFRDLILNKYHKAIKVKNPRRNNKEEYILPISIWSRLFTQIKPFIIERNIDGFPLMKFFHRQFDSVVEDFVSDNIFRLRRKLYNYFYTSIEKRKAVESLYQAYKLNDSDSFFNLFFQENIFLININKGLLYELFDYIKSFKKIQINYEKYKTLNIKKEAYFENLRLLAYLLGDLIFEQNVLDDWLFHDKKNSINSFKIYKYLADLAFRKGEAKKAIKYAKLSKKYTTTQKEKLDLNLSLTRLYTFVGDINGALELIKQVQNFNIKNKLSQRKKAEFYQELSFPFHDTDNNTQFALFNNKAKKIYKELNSRYEYCITGVNEGDGYWGSGKIEKAITTIKESLNKAIEWKLEHAINISYICLANIYSSINNKEENLKLYLNGIELSKKIGHVWDEIYGKIYYNIAKAETYNIDTSEELENLSNLALEYDYRYLYELAKSYRLIVSIFLKKNIQINNLDNLIINSSKIYHLSYDLLISKNKKNINKIFDLLSNVDGIKGRPYVIYYILSNYNSFLNNKQKDLLQSFAKKCYLNSYLSKIYKKRICNV